MRIIVDKVGVPPLHAISSKEVRLIFSSVPAKWSGLVEVVRLSGSRQSLLALYNATDKIFTIASRGHSKEESLRLVLVELASHAMGFKRGTFQNLQARYKSQINALVAPLMAALLPQLSSKKELVDCRELAQ